MPLRGLCCGPVSSALGFTDALGHVRNSKNLMLEHLSKFLTQIFPISVIVALGTFIYKECAEKSRRNKARISKERAYAHVLGREIKNNFEALDYFYKIIDFIESHRECKKIQVNLFRLTHGYESCQIVADNDSLEIQLPKFQSTWYERLLPELAEKDESLVACISKAYDNIYFLSDKRNLVASLMAGELSGFLKMCANTTVSLLAPERARIEAELISAYKALTGKEAIFP